MGVVAVKRHNISINIFREDSKNINDLICI